MSDLCHVGKCEQEPSHKSWCRYACVNPYHARLRSELEKAANVIVEQAGELEQKELSIKLDIRAMKRLTAERDTALSELAECEAANQSVAVCAKHTAEITSDDGLANGCYVCELAECRKELNRRRCASPEAPHHDAVSMGENSMTTPTTPQGESERCGCVDRNRPHFHHGGRTFYLPAAPLPERGEE